MGVTEKKVMKTYYVATYSGFEPIIIRKNSSDKHPSHNYFTTFKKAKNFLLSNIRYAVKVQKKNLKLAEKLKEF